MKLIPKIKILKSLVAVNVVCVAVNECAKCAQARTPPEALFSTSNWVDEIEGI